MLRYCMLLFLAVISCAFALSIDGEPPSSRQAVDSVLWKATAGSAGEDTTITLNGNLEWKETITVKKKQEQTEDYTLEGCCTLPSNLTLRDVITDCLMEVRENFPEEANNDEDAIARRRLTVINCFMQCVSYRQGLSEIDGSIKREEMVSSFLNDSRTLSLGISENMINRCINTAKGEGSETFDSNQDVGTCNTSSTELLKFVKCIQDLENLYCPAAYLRHSKYCDKRRRVMKAEMRQGAGGKKRNY